MQVWWIEEARRRLLGSRTANQAWGYQDKTESTVEATAVCGLSLLGSAGAESKSIRAEVRAAADWLVEVQHDDGSLGVSSALREPAWPTPYAVLLWRSLDGYEEPSRKALCWLLRRKGITVAHGNNLAVGDDTSIVGWPWLVGTYSWLEPTAVAILALRRGGRKSDARVSEGVRLIRDRAVATGGWNYGCGSAFGQPLRSQAGMTGLALLSLAGLLGYERSIENACRYLEGDLCTRRSERSLCWGLLGLRAWGREPAQAEQWLEERYRLSQRRVTPMQLGYLLLGVGGGSLDLLGINSRVRSTV